MLIFKFVRNAFAIRDCIFRSDVTDLLDRIDRDLRHRTKVVTYFRERGQNGFLTFHQKPLQPGAHWDGWILVELNNHWKIWMN